LDKERHFAPIYENLATNFPDLKIIMEHISTKELVELVKNPQYNNLFATVSLHHLLTIHNHIVEGGTKPHLMCMPIPKHYDDRKALLTEILG
jgi:dihydroorotase